MTWQSQFIDGRWQRVFVPVLEHALPVFVFDEQRKTCEACASFSVEYSAAGGQELQCAQGAGTHRSCSLLRAPGYACGPEAKLFEARQNAGADHPVETWNHGYPRSC